MTKFDKQGYLLKTGYIYSFLLLFYTGLQSLIEGMVDIGIVEYITTIPLLVIIYCLLSKEE